MRIGKFRTSYTTLIKQADLSSQIFRDARSRQQKGVAIQHDLEYSVEVAFLKTYLAWELFLEESFYLFLIGKKPKRSSNVQSRLKRNSVAVGKGIVLMTKDYVDWNHEKVKERAKFLLLNGEPYQTALSLHAKNLNDIKKIRNAIAHSSDFAQKAFHDQVLCQNLGQRMTPMSVGAYLVRVKPNPPQIQTWFEHYVETLLDAARRIIQ